MFHTTGKNGLQQKITNMLKRTYGVLSPSKDSCIVCGKPQDDELGLCQFCTAQIPWIQHVRCSICGRHEVCHDCLRRKHTHFICNRSAVRYNSEMKQWLAQYKYRKNERLEPLMIEMLYTTYTMITRELERSHRIIDYISFIPLSEERLEERGFNQAKRLAQGIVNLSNVPLLPILSRTRHTHKQSYKTRAERLKGLEGVFILNQAVLAKILPSAMSQTHASGISGAPMNILLVDDVFTTGSTMNQCAKVLSSSMTANIYGLTWAR